MIKDLITFSNLSPVGSLEAYTHWANQVPMLSQEEEISLANSYRNHEDLTAAQKLVLPHLRFVIKIARGYSGYGLAVGDLIQEGNVGLMKAVKRFDPNMGVRLVSFAIHWIKAEIHEFILRNWRIVKIATTKAQRKLFFNLRKMRNRVEHFGQKEMLDVAEELNVSPDVVEEMTMRMDAAYDIGFDGEDDNGDGERNFAPMHYLEDKRYDPARIMESSDWEEQGQTQLSKALVMLDERSQDILQQRWLAEDKATLQDLAVKYNVSAERIRQLEQNAMKKLRAAMEVEMAV